MTVDSATAASQNGASTDQCIIWQIYNDHAATQLLQGEYESNQILYVLFCEDLSSIGFSMKGKSLEQNNLKT